MSKPNFAWLIEDDEKQQTISDKKTEYFSSRF